jgi:hypothetical protein
MEQKRKFSRVTVGKIYKGKEGKPDYLKLDHYSKKELFDAISGMDEKGLYLNLESKNSQLAGIEKALAEGKMKPENAEKARERVNKMPDFVRFDVVLVKRD